MGVAKVTLNGTTLIDVTQKTVESETMLSGITALDMAGEDITGSYLPDFVIGFEYNNSTNRYEPDKTYSEIYQAYQAGQNIVVSSQDYTGQMLFGGNFNTMQGTFDYYVYADNGRSDSYIYYRLNNSGTITEISVITKYDIINQNKTVTPSTSQQSITADSGYTGLGTVTINAIPTMVLPTAAAATSTGTAKATVNRSTSNQYINIPTGYNSTSAYYTIASTPNMTLPTAAAATSTGVNKATINRSTAAQYINIPIGYNSASAFYSIAATANGSVYTPTATKGTVTNNSVSITPGVSYSAGYLSTTGQKSGTAVTVYASELVNGTKSITSNGTGIDVTNYANVDVNVSSNSGSKLTITGSGDQGYCFINYNVSNYYSPTTLDIVPGYGLNAWVRRSNGGIFLNGVKVSTESFKLDDIHQDVQVDLEDDGTSSFIYITIDTPKITNLDKITQKIISGVVIGDASYVASGTFSNFSYLQTAIFNSASYIGAYAFQSCYDLSYACFSSALSIGYSAFTNCTSLSTICAPNVTHISSSAFDRCSHFLNANFPNAIHVGNYAFWSCYSLSTISFPNLTTLETGVFSSCTSLSEAIFPKVTTLGSSVFSNCINLKIASFSVFSGTIPSGVFYSCKSLVSVAFPNATSTLGSVFYGCNLLSDISLPKMTYINTSCFMYCSSIISINLPSAIYIGGYAFRYCRELTTVSIPILSSYIGAYAFANCYHLLSVYMNNVPAVPTLAASAVFASTPIAGYTESTGGVYGSIFVPSSLYNSFITNTIWSWFSSRLVSV